MRTIIDTLQDYTAKSPNTAILFDDVYSKGITYAQLDDMSGRIYAWMKSQGLGKEDFVLIRCDDAHEGIAGIVAGKIKDSFYRPAVICMKTQGEGELLKGTGRSIEGVSLYDLLNRYSGLFEKFGGHSGACGFTIKEEYFEELREGLLKDASELKTSEPELFSRKYPSDMDISVSDASIELADQIELLSPFGNANPRPVFRIRDVLISDVRYMGADEQHVRFTARDESGKYLGCVLFNRAGEYRTVLSDMKRHGLIGSIEAQIWQGQKRLQFIVENIID